MTAPAPGPTPEVLLALLVELDRVRATTLDLIERVSPPLLPLPPPDTDDGHTDDPTPGLHELLVGARRAVLGNPAAAKAVHDLLVAQGRRYARTAEGARLRDALAASEAVDHLRRIWETVSLNVLAGPAAFSGVPDAWVETLTDAVTGSVVIDTVLRRLRPEGSL
jgi:hypothetical protein